VFATDEKVIVATLFLGSRFCVRPVLANNGNRSAEFSGNAQDDDDEEEIVLNVKSPVSSMSKERPSTVKYETSERNDKMYTPQYFAMGPQNPMYSPGLPRESFPGNFQAFASPPPFVPNQGNSTPDPRFQAAVGARGPIPIMSTMQQHQPVMYPPFPLDMMQQPAGHPQAKSTIEDVTRNGQEQTPNVNPKSTQKKLLMPSRLF